MPRDPLPPTAARPEGSLRVHDLRAGYGQTVILDGVSLDVARGERVAIIGRNGVGKTTFLSTLVGRTRLYRGSIRLGGTEIGPWPGHRRFEAGMAFVPQEREIFPSLTVRENLTVAKRPGRWTVDRICELFPNLGDRLDQRGTQLSGGEQQMLAIGRAMMSSPTVLLMDEPSEGLAPVIVEQMMAAIERIVADDGLTVLLIEQNARIALDFAPRTLVFDGGRIVFDGPSAELDGDSDLLTRLAGVAGQTTARTALH